MSKDDLKVVLFAAVVCIVCSLLLSVTAASLKERQDQNVELDRKLNVLKAFGQSIVDENNKPLGKEEVDRIFETNISEVFLDKETGEMVEGFTADQLSKKELKAKNIGEKTKLPLYLWKDGEKVSRYALPVSGMGLWSVIYGYLALDSDLSTILGVTFYKHGETPGLGGEVSTDAFQDQFKGKKIFAGGKLLPFEVVKGSVESKYPDGCDYAVDGITGATMTGNGITKFLQNDIQHYEKYFSSKRGN